MKKIWEIKIRKFRLFFVRCNIIDRWQLPIKCITECITMIDRNRRFSMSHYRSNFEIKRNATWKRRSSYLRKLISMNREHGNRFLFFITLYDVNLLLKVYLFLLYMFDYIHNKRFYYKNKIQFIWFKWIYIDWSSIDSIYRSKIEYNEWYSSNWINKTCNTTRWWTKIFWCINLLFRRYSNVTQSCER